MDMVYRREESSASGKCSWSERRQAPWPESATGCYPVIAHVQSAGTSHRRVGGDLWAANALPVQLLRGCRWPDVLGPSRSYGPRRRASYVDKILKGTKPADLPVEVLTG